LVQSRAFVLDNFFVCVYRRLGLVFDSFWGLGSKRFEFLVVTVDVCEFGSRDEDVDEVSVGDQVKCMEFFDLPPVGFHMLRDYFIVGASGIEFI
jgi:hypothetical protein